MKVLFVNPNWGSVVSKKDKRFNRAWPPLCLLNCGALLEREGIRVELIDARAQFVAPFEIAKRIKEFDKVFITSSPIDRWQCPNLDIDLFTQQIEEIDKEDRERLYIMGVHGTLYPEKLLELTSARAIIRGEPELTVLDICKEKDLSEIKGITYRRNGKISSNPDRPLLDLNDLPIPAFHLIDINNYGYELLGDKFVLFEGSRGCPYPCIYCLKTMYGKGYRKKSPERLIEDIDYAIHKIGARSGYFIDLEFTLNKELVNKLCDFLIKRRYDFRWCCQTRADTIDLDILKKMKEAGCELIHYGVETGSPRVMELIDKKISLSKIAEGIAITKKIGIETACFFMFGFPGETMEDMEETIRFVKELDPTYASFHIASPYPGTKLYEYTEKEELFPEAYTKEHSLKELKKITGRAFREYYLRPRYLYPRLLHGNLNSFVRQLKLFWEFIR